MKLSAVVSGGKVGVGAGILGAGVAVGWGVSVGMPEGCPERTIYAGIVVERTFSVA